VLRGGSEVRLTRRWPSGGGGALLESEQIIVRVDRTELPSASVCRAVQATSCPATGRFVLVSKQSVVEQVQVGERVAFRNELALRTGRSPHDVAHRLELVGGVS